MLKQKLSEALEKRVDKNNNDTIYHFVVGLCLIIGSWPYTTVENEDDTGKYLEYSFVLEDNLRGSIEGQIAIISQSEASGSESDFAITEDGLKVIGYLDALIRDDKTTTSYETTNKDGLYQLIYKIKCYI